MNIGLALVLIFDERVAFFVGVFDVVEEVRDMKIYQSQ